MPASGGGGGGGEGGDMTLARDIDGGEGTKRGSGGGWSGARSELVLN